MPSESRPLSIAIAALGGQGGGVLSDWLVAVAELHGWIVQATSVPGVAQRTELPFTTSRCARRRASRSIGRCWR